MKIKKLLLETNPDEASVNMRRFNDWLNAGRPSPVDTSIHRRENVARCSDSKLMGYRDICIKENRPLALKEIEAELARRGLINKSSNKTNLLDQIVITANLFDKNLKNAIEEEIDTAGGEDKVADRTRFIDLVIYIQSLKKSEPTNVAIIIASMMLAICMKKQIFADGLKELFLKSDLSKKYGIDSSKLVDIIRTGLQDENVKNKILEIVKSDNLSEDIEKHDELNPKLFLNDKLIPEVREKLLQIAKEFSEGFAENNVQINIKDVQLVGSNASYNYTKDSDIDLHIVVEPVDKIEIQDVYSMLYNAQKSIWNDKYDISIHGIPVEVYVELENAENASRGRYSILNDEWVKIPEVEDIPDLDQDIFDKNFSEWEDRYYKVVKNIEDATLDEKVNTPEIEEIDSLIDELYALRKESLSTNGEYSLGNLIFKEFRNRGYLDKLKKIKNKLVGDELSLDEDHES